MPVGSTATLSDPEADCEALSAASKKKSKKKPTGRQRPPKPVRLACKLALMLFQAATDEEREAAETALVEETEDKEIVYDYAMIVLQNLHARERHDLNRDGASSLPIHYQ